jgi:hypothetical protein
MMPMPRPWGPVFRFCSSRAGGLAGGDARPENIVFVPPFVAEIKMRTDGHIIRPLAADGAITRYEAEPAYSGSCLVPIILKVRAYDPGDFTHTIKIWGEGLID